MSTESASGTPSQPSLLVLVKQILILAGFWWIGYLLHQKLGVPVSAGILGMVNQTTIVTLKGSNQIKSIRNQNPTSSGNINATSKIMRNLQ